VDNSQTGTDKSVPCPSQPVGACRKDSNERINRINYEISVLQALRERLCCKEIWVLGANRYRNPDEDLPICSSIRRLAAFQKAALAGVPVSAVNDKRAAQGWADYQAVARELLV
jgi:hypothetical protein